MALLSRLASLIAGGAVARASSDAVEPILEGAKQQAWGERAIRVLAPSVAAEAAARQIDSPVDFANDAKRTGIGASRFEVLRKLATVFPGFPELLRLRRRDAISPVEIRAALRREGY